MPLPAVGPLAALGGPWGAGLMFGGMALNFLGQNRMAGQLGENTRATLQGAANAKETEVNLAKDVWFGNRGEKLEALNQKGWRETEDFNRGIKLAGRYMEDFAPKMGNFQRQENIKNAINTLNPEIQKAARQAAGLQAAQTSFGDAVNYAAQQGKGGSYQLDKLKLMLGMGPRFT